MHCNVLFTPAAVCLRATHLTYKNFCWPTCRLHVFSQICRTCEQRLNVNCKSLPIKPRTVAALLSECQCRVNLVLVIRGNGHKLPRA